MDRIPADSIPLVRIERMSKVYQQGAVPVNALADITLQFRKGEFTALVGPSGSGKTTLLAFPLCEIAGIAIALGGENLASLPRAALAELRLKKIGFIFQDYNLLPVLSALENVEYVLLLQGISAGERRRRAAVALQQVGLEGYEERRPSQL